VAQKLLLGRDLSQQSARKCGLKLTLECADLTGMRTWSPKCSVLAILILACGWSATSTTGPSATPASVSRKFSAGQLFGNRFRDDPRDIGSLSVAVSLAIFNPPSTLVVNPGPGVTNFTPASGTTPDTLSFTYNHRH